MQYVSEKMGAAEGTKLSEEYTEMEKVSVYISHQVFPFFYIIIIIIIIIIIMIYGPSSTLLFFT